MEQWCFHAFEQTTPIRGRATIAAEMILEAKFLGEAVKELWNRRTKGEY
jgi:hypothetical protein